MSKHLLKKNQLFPLARNQAIFILSGGKKAVSKLFLKIGSLLKEIVKKKKLYSLWKKNGKHSAIAAAIAKIAQEGKLKIESGQIRYNNFINYFSPIILNNIKSEVSVKSFSYNYFT